MAASSGAPRVVVHGCALLGGRIVVRAISHACAKNGQVVLMLLGEEVW
jgi:hypothetical protein